MTAQHDLPLPPSVPSGTVVINGRCVLRPEGEHRVVVVAGLPVHHYSVNDAVAEAYARVFLVDSGFATQTEVARAFRCAERTVKRHQLRYADGGMTALATRSGWRPGRGRIPTERGRLIARLKAEGLSNCEIARRLGVTEKAIRKQIGPREDPPPQPTLPLAAVSGGPSASSPHGTAAERPASPVTPPRDRGPDERPDGDAPRPSL